MNHTAWLFVRFFSPMGIDEVTNHLSFWPETDIHRAIAAYVAQRVAEAVGPLEKELAKADSMLAAVDLNRSGWAPSFIDELTERACKGPHKGPAELLVEACNTVDFTRKALTTAESDRDSLAALVVRMKEFISECEIAEDRSNLDGDSAEVVLGQINDGAEEVLKLLPADLSDCVTVPRAEWEALKAGKGILGDR